MRAKNATIRDAILEDLVALHQSLTGSGTGPVGISGEEPVEEDETSRFELLFEHAPCGMLLAEIVRDRYRQPREYRVARVNSRYAQLLGMPRVAVLEAPFAEVLPGGLADWSGALETVSLKGRPAQGISLCGQTLRPLRVQIFLPRRDTLAVMLEDLEAFPEPRESAWAGGRLAERVLADTSELVCRFRPGGQLTYANDAYCAFFGCPRDQLIGHNYMESVAGEAADFVRSRIEIICRDRPAIVYESPCHLKSGTRWIEWNDTGIFDADGKLAEYQSAGRDVTERKLREIEERRAEGLVRDLLEHQARRFRTHQAAASKTVTETQAMMEEIRNCRDEMRRLERLTIQGAIMVCMRCARIHDDEGHWMLPHPYLELHTEASVSVGVCPYCRGKVDGNPKRQGDSNGGAG